MMQLLLLTPLDLARSKLQRQSSIPLLGLAKGTVFLSKSNFFILLTQCKALALQNTLTFVTLSCASGDFTNLVMKWALPEYANLIIRKGNIKLMSLKESFNSRLKAEGDETSTNLYVSNLPRDMTEAVSRSSSPNIPYSMLRTAIGTWCYFHGLYRQF